MNTPNLISPLSSALGAIDASRNGKAGTANGPDFSLLLGEKRSDLTPPAAQRASQGPVSRETPSRPRSESASVRAASQPSSSHAATASGNNAANDANRGANTARTNETGRSGSGRAADASSASGTAAAGQSGQPQSAAAEGSSATATPANAAAVAQTGADAGTSGTTDTFTTEAGLTHDAQWLAQHAAESGLPGVAVAALAGEASPTADVVLPVQGLAAEGAATAQGAQAAVLASLGDPAEADLPLAQRAPTLPGLEARVAGDAAHAGLVNLAAEQTQPAVAGTQAAQAFTFNAESARFLSGATPAAGTLQAAVNANSATAPALPVSTDPAGAATTHALQLDAFNAMVAAARATSGTSLPPVAVLAENPFAQPAGTPIPGMMPLNGLPAATVAAPTLGSINAPLNSPQWSAELGRQFISISQAAKGIGQVAELRLDPPELGPLRITINLSDNVAHAVFSSPHALVRQTVENALPQLQQMLAQAGISLGEANVNDQHTSGQPGEGAAQGGRSGARKSGNEFATAGVSDAADMRPGRPTDPNSLVDTFA